MRRYIVILVSACLLGYNCKYNGRNNFKTEITRLRDDLLIPVCPEELGGLPTPRPPAQFDKADGNALLDGLAGIIDINGSDVTNNFLAGALKALSIAKKNGVHKAILKERSPSCGVSSVYIAQKGEKPVPGMGVTAALLQRNGVKIISDEEL
jgi:uncharacterized protein YbbK (DUF523 family)